MNSWNMSDKECIDFAINELVKMDVIKTADVLDAHREKSRKPIRHTLMAMQI